MTKSPIGMIGYMGTFWHIAKPCKEIALRAYGLYVMENAHWTAGAEVVLSRERGTDRPRLGLGFEILAVERSRVRIPKPAVFCPLTVLETHLVSASVISEAPSASFSSMGI